MKFNYILIIVLLITSCSPTEQLMTVKYPGDGPAPGSGFIYGLPQTTLMVDVDVVRTTKIKGPYADFAKTYLAIDKVIREEETYWEIQDINVSSYLEADPEHIYNVKTGESQVAFDNFFDLTKQGLILDLTNLARHPKTYKYLHDQEERLIDFKDVTVTGGIGYVKDTLYRLVFKDSAFIKVPMLKNQVEAKSLDQKAEEAADFIFEIRNQRLYFISGENNPLPGEGAFKKALDEMNRLEEEYLSLFIGKTYKDTLNYTFEITPSGNPVEDRVTLFRFSREHGVFSQSIVEGIPVVVEFQPSSNGLVARVNPVKETAGSVHSLIYRIANKTNIKVSMANQTLLEDKRLIYQYGQTVTLPLSVTFSSEN